MYFEFLLNRINADTRQVDIQPHNVYRLCLNDISFVFFCLSTGVPVLFIILWIGSRVYFENTEFVLTLKHISCCTSHLKRPPADWLKCTCLPIQMLGHHWGLALLVDHQRTNCCVYSGKLCWNQQNDGQCYTPSRSQIVMQIICLLSF